MGRRKRKAARPNAGKRVSSPYEIVRDQIGILERKLGREIYLELTPGIASDPDLVEEVSIWLDSWLEGRREYPPAFIDVYNDPYEIHRPPYRVSRLLITSHIRLGKLLYIRGRRGCYDFVGIDLPTDVYDWYPLRINDTFNDSLIVITDPRSELTTTIEASSIMAADWDMLQRSDTWDKLFVIVPHTTYRREEPWPCVRRSNYHMFLDLFEDNPGVYTMTHVNHYSVIVSLEAIDFNDMFHDIQRLCDDPLLNREHYLETEVFAHET